MKFGAFFAAFLLVAAIFSYLSGGIMTAFLCVISTVCIVVIFGAAIGLYCHEFQIIQSLSNKNVILRGFTAIVALAAGTVLMKYGHDMAATIIMITVWLLLILEK